MRQQWFTHVRLLVAHLTRSQASLSRSRSPPRLLTDMTLRRFEISACTATPEDLPPSLAQHGSCQRPPTSPPLPFQDTHPLGL